MRLMIIILLCVGMAQAADNNPGAAYNVSVSTPVLTVKQVYKPVSLRDPMIVSDVFGDQKVWPEIQNADVSKATFSIYNLSLTGIMEDSNGKQAMLKDVNSQSSYTLRFGKLMDAKKKTVKGITGVIRGKRVALITEDKKILSLNLRVKE